MSRLRKYHTKADIEKFFAEAEAYGATVSEKRNSRGYIEYRWFSRRTAKRNHQAGKHIAVFFDTQKLLVSLLKFFCFKHFICKSFYNLLSKKTVLNPGIQLSDLVSLSAESTFYFFVDKTTHYRHNRHKNEHHQCQ